MTNDEREAVIEKAAKAMCERAGEEKWEDCPQDWYRADAEAALKVFEQAHTPTDDELRDAIDHIQGAVEFQDAINPEAVRVLVAAARRPVQGEPGEARRAAERWAARTPFGPESAPIQAFEAGWRAARAARGEPSALIECPHWSPGKITMRKGCTACASVQGELSGVPGQLEPTDTQVRQIRSDFADELTRLGIYTIDIHEIRRRAAFEEGENR